FLLPDMRPTTQGVALATLSTLLSLGAVEAVLSYSSHGDLGVRPYRLRLSDPNIVSEPYLETANDVPYTTRLSYRGRLGVVPGTITTNPQGFRTTPAQAAESYEKVDVLCLGDSFTFGYLVGDEETYPKHLATLYERSGKTVVNAGYVGGFTFDAASLRYRNTL